MAASARRVGRRGGKCFSATTETEQKFKYGIKEEDIKTFDDRARRCLDLANASKSENVQHTLDQVVREFQRFEGDTGSSEVQVAVLTVKINNLMDHMREHQKDYHTRHGLDKMVSKRRKLLKHLRKNNFDAYKRVLHRFGLRDIIRQLQDNKIRQGKRKIRFRGS